MMEVELSIQTMERKMVENTEYQSDSLFLCGHLSEEFIKEREDIVWHSSVLRCWVILL